LITISPSHAFDLQAQHDGHVQIRGADLQGVALELEQQV